MQQEDGAVRLETMLGYLAEDPGNGALARDCADAALAANQPQVAHDIFVKLEATAPLDEQTTAVAGMAAMRCGDQQTAQRHFTTLMQAHDQDIGLRFNMAWSLTLAGDHTASLDMIDDEMIASLPQAAMLDLQLRHELGEFDAAAERLDEYVERFPDYGPLQAAASVLAMDVDRADLARACALKAGDHPDALATLGTLELADDRLAEAQLLFGQSLATKALNPRANLGLGLAELAAGNAGASLPHLDLGAQQFGDHLGSWIASGWAHFLAGDPETARARFETALNQDDSFGEAQGSVAAMDAFAGDFEKARERLKIASRLDRQSFSVALTGMVLAAAEGDQTRADKIFEIVSTQPLTHDGKTLAEVLAKSAI